MKKTLCSIAVLCALLSNKSNAQTIPNGSFERWVMKSGVEIPEGWINSEELNCSPLSSSKSTDKADSLYALKLETANCALAGGIHEGFAIRTFPVTKKPFYLNGSYKAVRVNTDSSQIKVIMKKGAVEIGSAVLNIYASVPSYKGFSLPIVYTTTDIPDKAEIYLFSDKIGKEAYGNKLWIDKLTFSDVLVSIKEQQSDVEDIVLYPNPAQDKISLKGNRLMEGKVYVIRDISGKAILQGVVSDNSIDITSLTSGFYLVQIGDTDKKMLKMIKE